MQPTLSTHLLRCSLVASALGAATLALAACGGSEEGCTTIGCGSDTAPRGSAGTASGTGGSTGAPGVNNQPNQPSFIDPNETGSSGNTLGEVCRSLTFQANVSPVNVLILLDRSVSMLDPVDRANPSAGTRWTAITTALKSFVSKTELAGTRMGLQFFGLMTQDDCSADKYAVPAVAVAPIESNRQALVSAVDATLPGSLTPTLPAVQGALRYALDVAKRPENANIPTVLILASDILPTECGTSLPDGTLTTPFPAVLSTLRSYSEPPLDAAGKPTQPPIVTYAIGFEELGANARALADAGGGQTFLVGGAGADLGGRFQDALLSIVYKPLSCEIDVPQTAADTGERVDFDKVRVQFTGAASGLKTEFPRANRPGDCATEQGWFYDDNVAPKKIQFCPKACESLGAGDLTLELGCSPRKIVL